MGTLYRLTSPSGKSYIGVSSKTTEARWAKHIEHALGRRDSGALYSALRKYGINSFSVETLVIANDWEYLCELEKRAISVMRTKAPYGYNITDGGEGTIGRAISEEQRMNISMGQKRRFQRFDEIEKARGNGYKGAATKRDFRDPQYNELRKSTPTFTTKLNHSLAVREAMAKPETAVKVKECARQRASDPNWRIKISQSKTGKKVAHTIEGDAARKAGILSAWADPIKKAARLEKNRVARECKIQQGESNGN